MSDRNQAQVIQSLTDLNQVLVEHDKVGEATSLALGITQMLRAPLLDLKCVRLRQRLDVLEMYLKDLPLAVIRTYAKAQADIQQLLSSSLEPSSRTLRMEKVKDSLESLEVFDMGVHDLKQKGILVSPSKIGEGGFGKVYKGTITGVPTVLKTVKLDESDEELDLEEVKEVMGEDRTLPEEYQPQEYRLGVTLNDLVLTDQCPNFMLTYDVGLCDQGDQTEAVYFLEEASFDLSEAFRQSFFGPVSQVSLLAQLLIALYYAHTRLKVVHRDVKAENILLLETPTLVRTLMTYEVDGRTFVIENTGVILCLADFGVAESEARIDASRDIRDCLATFLGGHYHTHYGHRHKGYHDLSAPLTQALETAYSAAFGDALDALEFILQSVKYVPANLPVSKVLKSTTQLSKSELGAMGVASDKSLVKAAMRGLPEVVKQMADQASQEYLNLALVAAAVKGDTDAIDILIEKGANNHEALVLTLTIIENDIATFPGPAGKYMSYLPPNLDLSFFVTLVFASADVTGVAVALKKLLQTSPQDRKDLNKLLVVAGFNGAPEVVELLIDEGATNLDQAYRAAHELTDNSEATKVLESRGAKNAGAYPSFPPGSLALFKTLSTLIRDYGLNNDRVRNLVRLWDLLKGYELDPLSKDVVEAAVKGIDELVVELADQASQEDLNLALVAAAVNGDTDTIDVLLEKGAKDYEAVVITTSIMVNGGKGARYLKYLLEHLNLSFFMAFVLASYNVNGADGILKKLLARGYLQDRKDLNKLLVAAGLNGSPGVAEVIINEGATNLDQALRAAKLTDNSRVAKVLESRGAKEGGAYPTLPAGSLAVFEPLNTLVHKYGLVNSRARDLIKVWDKVKESEVGSGRALVRAAVEGSCEAATELADQASQADLNLALIAATVRGDTELIDILLEEGADNHDDLILTLIIRPTGPDVFGKYARRYLQDYLDLSFFMTFVLASYNMKGVSSVLSKLIERSLRDRKDLDKLLVAAGFNGSPEVVEVLLDEGATNLDQALRAAKLADNRDVVELLESRGAQEGGAYPTLPAGSLYLFEAINDLVGKHQLDNSRAVGLVKFYNHVKGFREPLE